MIYQARSKQLELLTFGKCASLEVIVDTYYIDFFSLHFYLRVDIDLECKI